MNLYSIYDAKAETWLPPFLAQNHELAKRDLFTAVSGSSNTPIAQFPTDFSLVCLGDWSAGSPNPVSLAQIPENIGTVWMIICEFEMRRKTPKNEVNDESKGTL